MAEEWGNIIIRSTVEVANAFQEESLGSAFRKLALQASVDTKFVDPLSASVDKIVVNDNIVELSYECSEWVLISEMLVSKGEGVEYYARHADEYGMLNFYALGPEGKRVGFQVDQEGDEAEDEEYLETVSRLLAEWKKIIPQDIHKRFSDFADINPEDFLM